MTCTNLQLCYGDFPIKERKRLARASLMETAKTAAEVGAIWLHDSQWLKEHVLEVEGLEILKKKLSEDKGLVLISPHLGNWEVTAPFFAIDEPLVALYQPSPDPDLDSFIINSRSKPNMTMAPTNRRGVALLLKTLKGGGTIGILPDQVPDEETSGVMAPFFSEPAKTMTLVHSLIQRTKCNVIMLVAFRVRGGFKILYQECDADVYSEDSVTSATGLNRSIENCVKLAPAQYQWEYKRFKGRPMGEPY